MNNPLFLRGKVGNKKSFITQVYMVVSGMLQAVNMTQTLPISEMSVA